MAQLKGSILFTGSVGNIRSYYSNQLKRYILATKGGASKELILHNPVFARTRENMSEFTACTLWASQLRKSLLDIAHLHQGYYFSEIVAQAKRIQKHDENHDRGFRSVASSLFPEQLSQINFNMMHPFDRVLSHEFETQLSQDNQTVMLKMPGFKSFMHLNWPARYQSYRIALVIAQLPDFNWVALDSAFQPACKDMEMLSVSAFSDWLPCSTDTVDILLSASFAQPALQIPGTTVVVAMGIEIAATSPNSGALYPTGTMKIVEYFVN